jgi:hypothetical protein
LEPDEEDLQAAYQRVVGIVPADPPGGCSAMSLGAAQYRSWTRRLLPNWLASWPIARTALLLVLRRKLFWLLLALRRSK